MNTPSISRLDCRVEVDFDFTHIDEVVLTLFNIFTCPIKLESTYYMLTLNDHWYNLQYFARCRTLEYGCIDKCKDSGYRTKMHFKDLHTGEEFEYRHTIDGLCIHQLTALNLREMLVWWISGLSFEEARRFVSDQNGILTVDNFVTHVQWLEGNCVNELSLYADRQIKRQNELTINLPVQNTVPQRQFGQPLTEVDISSDSSSSSSLSTSSFAL